MADKKTIVIGLDGLTFDLIGSWMQKGHMPNIKKAIENGVSGELMTVIPPQTATAWTSFATGLNPGKHGVYFFSKYKDSLLDLMGKDMHLVDSGFLGITYYEVLERNNKKSILINLPNSYPPRTKDIMITGIQTKAESFIYPNGLIEEMPMFKEYKITPSPSLLSSDEFLKEVKKIENVRFECAKYLFRRKEWDHFFVLFSAPDWIQHRYYSHLKSNKLKKISKFIDVYNEIDRMVGWLLDNAPKNTNIIIMSDHGFGHFNGSFGVNCYLEKKGLLVRTRDYGSDPWAGVTEERIKKIDQKRLFVFRIRRLNDIIKKSSLLTRIGNGVYKVLRRYTPLYIVAEKQAVDISKTKALCPISSFYGIFINDKIRFKDGIVSEGEKERIINELVVDLKTLRTPEGEPLFEGVYRKEEIHFGSNLSKAPDILFKRNFGLSHGMDGLMFSKIPINGHMQNGVFVAVGPGIYKGRKIENATILDICPTILHIMGCPIPSDVDGHVLKEIFKSQ